MRERKETIISLRLDEHHLTMLEKLTTKLETNKSQLLRTLIFVAYEKQIQKEEGGQYYKGTLEELE